MALFVALIAALILAVVVVLVVMAWVLLAPLMRQRRDRKEREPDEDDLGAAVLFGRPVMRVETHHRERRDPVRDTVVVRARQAPPPPPAPVETAPAVAARAAAIPVTTPEAAPSPPAASAPPPPAAPAPPPPATPAPPPLATPAPPPSAPLPPVADVLVVTADTALSACQLGILASRGCASRRAKTASDAVDELRLRIPDLVLLDACATSEAVPLVAAIRAWHATELVPVVLFTPHADADVTRCAAEFGVTDVVVNAQNVPGLVERALPYWLAGVGVFSSTFD